jgi:hypothetical protein
MRVMFVASIIAMLAGPALAQDGHVPRYGEKDPDKTAAQIQADKAAERAYKNSLGNIPDKSPSDPWGAVRSTDAPKASASPSKTKKAGNANN